MRLPLGSIYFRDLGEDVKKTIALSMGTLALLASGFVPAQAAEANAPEPVTQVAAVPDIASKMDAEAARNWLGKRVGNLIELDSKSSAQKYERGYVVNYVDGNTAYQSAMSTQVFDFWTGANNPAITFEAQVARYGYPTGTETANHYWRHMSQGVLTRFYRESGDDMYGTTLAYTPSAGKVMDRSWWQYADDAINWNESVVLGDSAVIPSWNTGYVAQGLQAAGYSANEYTAAGAGISATGRDGISIKNMVVDNGVALGIGTPWIVDIQASAADADVDSATLESDLRETIATLQKVYPNARIMVSDVPSTAEDAKLNDLSQRLEAIAGDSGARFVSTRGWISMYGLEGQVGPDGVLSASAQEKLVSPLKWALRNAVK